MRNKFGLLEAVAFIIGFALAIPYFLAVTIVRMIYGREKAARMLGVKL